MSVLAFFALGAVALVVLVGSLWVAPRMPRRARLALAVAGVAAVPMAWIAVLALADQALRVTAPVSGLTFASYVGLAVALFVLLQGVGMLLPERRVWLAAAAAPVAAAVLASFRPNTTAGGVVSVLLSVVLLGAAATLPRAAALASVDRSRAFVGIVVALMLFLGGAYGGLLGAAAVREEGLGLAEAARDWRLEVEPSFEGTYRLVVPFPAVGAPDFESVVAEWQGHARVAQGDGVVSFVERRDSLEIVARGAVVASAPYLFHAPEGLRQDLSPYEVPDVAVELLDAPANATVMLRWVAVASLSGEMCASRELSLVVDVGEPARLVPADDRALWPGATCAMRS